MSVAMTVLRLGIDIPSLVKVLGRPFVLSLQAHAEAGADRKRKDGLCCRCHTGVAAITRPLHRTLDRRWVLRNGSAALERARFKGQIRGDPVGAHSSGSTQAIHAVDHCYLPCAKLVVVSRGTSIRCLHKSNRSVALARPDPRATCFNMAERRYLVVMPCQSVGMTYVVRLLALVFTRAKFGCF